MVIKSINWTYIDEVDRFTSMDSHDQSNDLETAGATTYECECLEPCNCDHENE